MNKRYVIIFYTKEPKVPEVYWSDTKDMEKLFGRIVELTQKGAKFSIYEVGECVGDFS